jgi:hypothetical protein
MFLLGVSVFNAELCFEFRLAELAACPRCQQADALSIIAMFFSKPALWLCFLRPSPAVLGHRLRPRVL